MEVDIAGSKTSEYICDSNEALEFKLIRSLKDLIDDAVIFKPEMTHQIFGDNESIFGYRDLRVKLYYTACQLNLYMEPQFSSIVDPKSSEGVEADNVIKMLQEKLKIPFTQNMDEFSKTLREDESFKPFGDKLTSFNVGTEDGTKTYEIYHCDTSNEKFLLFHDRLQTFILFFIDAASYIDVDDPKWQFFVVYERFRLESGEWGHGVVGYCTVYQYYAYPDLVRPRISQMLVLPPYQCRGVGAQLLCAVYHHYLTDPAVRDITVEDPNEEFQHLRDYVDACLCMNLESFSRDKLWQGYNPVMAADACSKYKINKKQARRVYEILRLKETNIHSVEDFSSYRLDVKRRLNLPFHKETSLVKRLEKMNMDQQQMLSALGVKSAEERFQLLDQMFTETERQYRRTLLRVDRHPLSSPLFP